MAIQTVLGVPVTAVAVPITAVASTRRYPESSGGMSLSHHHRIPSVPTAFSGAMPPAISLSPLSLFTLVDGFKREEISQVWPNADAKEQALRRRCQLIKGVILIICVATSVGGFVGGTSGNSGENHDSTRLGVGLGIGAIFGIASFVTLLWLCLSCECASADQARQEMARDQQRRDLRTAWGNTDYLAFLDSKLKIMYGPLVRAQGETEEEFLARGRTLQLLQPPLSSKDFYDAACIMLRHHALYKKWEDYIRPVNATDQATLDREMEVMLEMAGLFVRSEIVQARQKAAFTTA